MGGDRDVKYCGIWRRRKLISCEDFDYEILLFCKEARDGYKGSEKWCFHKYFLNLLEYIFIQYIFGYGVHPFRLWFCWLGFVGLFAILYGLGHGIDTIASQLNGAAQLKDYIWFIPLFKL
jgi:hypothetical protein